MDDERPFLAKILENPADNNTKLVFADYLQEKGDDLSLKKSEFLRLTAIDLWYDNPEISNRLHVLAADIDTIFLAIVSSPNIVNCGRDDLESRRQMESWWNWASQPYGPNSEYRTHEESDLDEYLANHPRLRMDFVCTRRWSDMKPGNGGDFIRFCEQCRESVYFADNIIDARSLISQGKCLSVDLGVVRREQDLVNNITFFGRPSQETVENERQRRLPDAVSEKRLREKGRYPLDGILRVR